MPTAAFEFASATANGTQDVTDATRLAGVQSSDALAVLLATSGLTAAGAGTGGGGLSIGAAAKTRPWVASDITARSLGTNSPGDTSAAVALTLTNYVQASELVFVAGYRSVEGAQTATFADTPGNTYTEVELSNVTSGTDATLALYWSQIATMLKPADTATITFSGSGFQDRRIAGIAVRGASGTPIAGGPVTFQDGTFPQVQPDAITKQTGGAGKFIAIGVAGLEGGGVSKTWTALASWTLVTIAELAIYYRIYDVSSDTLVSFQPVASADTYPRTWMDIWPIDETSHTVAVSQVCAAMGDTDASASQACSRRQHTSRALTYMSTGATTADATYQFVGTVTNGLRFTVEDTPAAAYLIRGLAWWGSAVDAWCGYLQLSTASGAFTIEGLPFTPQAVIFLHTRSNNDTGAADAYMGIGAAVTSTNEWAMGIYDDNGQAAAATAGTSMEQDQCITVFTASAATIDGALDFTSFGTRSMTLNISNALSAAIKVPFIILRGNYGVVADTQRTSTGTDTTPALGVAPEGALFVSVGATADGLTNTSEAHVSMMTIGMAAKGGDEGCVLLSTDDAAATADVDRYHSSTKALRIQDPATANPAEADVSTWGSNDLTLDWTTATASARLFGVFAIGPTSRSLLRRPPSFQSLLAR